MFSEQDIAGDVCQYEEPDWQPLYDLVGVHLADWFMWMFEIELDDGGRVHAYKHITTRCYFHQAVDGRSFVYLRGGGYREIDRRHAIDLVFAEWEELSPAPDEDDVTALERARDAADAHCDADAA